MDETLERARERLDRDIEELARRYAGRDYCDVLDALEHEVAAAGVLPTRPDLSSLARQISVGQS